MVHSVLDAPLHIIVQLGLGAEPLATPFHPTTTSLHSKLGLVHAVLIPAILRFYPRRSGV